MAVSTLSGQVRLASVGCVYSQRPGPAGQCWLCLLSAARSGWAAQKSRSRSRSVRWEPRQTPGSSTGGGAHSASGHVALVPLTTTTHRVIYIYIRCLCHHLALLSGRRHSASGKAPALWPFGHLGHFSARFCQSVSLFQCQMPQGWPCHGVTALSASRLGRLNCQCRSTSGLSVSYRTVARLSLSLWPEIPASGYMYTGVLQNLPKDSIKCFPY